MRAEIFTMMAIVALGTTGALAQTTVESPADPKLEQQAPSAETSQPADSKARMPMRRELPIVPDPSAPSSEGAGAGTSGQVLRASSEPTEPAPKGEKKYWADVRSYKLAGERAALSRSVFEASAQKESPAEAGLREGNGCAATTPWQEYYAQQRSWFRTKQG